MESVASAFTGPDETTILSVLSADPKSLEELPPRDRAFALEASIRANIGTTLEPRKLPLRHFLANGVYVREISMPAGTVVVGWIHKHDHVAAMLTGDISIYDETGLQRMKGPTTFISKAGIKRAIYVHEDTIFTTVHGVGHCDPEQIERFKLAIAAALDGEDVVELKCEVACETVEEYEGFMITQSNIRGAIT